MQCKHTSSHVLSVVKSSLWRVSRENFPRLKINSLVRIDERVDRRTDFLKRKEIHPLLFPSSPRPLPCWGVFYALGGARVVTVSPGPGPAAPRRASSGQSPGAVLACGEGCGPRPRRSGRALPVSNAAVFIWKAGSATTHARAAGTGNIHDTLPSQLFLLTEAVTHDRGPL